MSPVTWASTSPLEGHCRKQPIRIFISGALTESFSKESIRSPCVGIKAGKTCQLPEDKAVFVSGKSWVWWQNSGGWGRWGSRYKPACPHKESQSQKNNQTPNQSALPSNLVYLRGVTQDADRQTVSQRNETKRKIHWKMELSWETVWTNIIKTLCPLQRKLMGHFFRCAVTRKSISCFHLIFKHKCTRCRLSATSGSIL